MKRYITVKEGMAEFQICRNTLVTIATKASAVIRIGKSIRIDRERFVAWLETNSAKL